MQDFAKGTGNNKEKWPKDMEMFWIPLKHYIKHCKSKNTDFHFTEQQCL